MEKRRVGIRIEELVVITGQQRQTSMLYVEWLGRTDSEAPVLVMSAGLGGSGAYWYPQVDALAQHYRIALYDQLGTGKSPAELPADYSVEAMALEVSEWLDSEGIHQVDFVGHAFGGLVGMSLAHQFPDRVNKLVVAGGWIKVDAHSVRCFEARVALLKNTGVDAYLRAQPIFLFPADWLSQREEMLEKQFQAQLEHFPGEHNVMCRINALRKFDASGWITTLEHPTLVITARDDVLVPWSVSRQLSEMLPRGQFECLEYGAHACSVTSPELFNERLTAFLCNNENA